MPENTEKTVKDTEQAVKAEKPAKTEKSDKKENKKRKCICPLFQEHRQVPSRCQKRGQKNCVANPKVCV